MGTTYNVKLVADSSQIDFVQLQSDIQTELERINSLMSTYLADSELSKLNRAEVGQAFQVSSDTFAVIEYAQKVSTLSGGAFDITVGPLVDLWGFGPQSMNFRLPEPELVRGRLNAIGFEKLLLNPELSSVVKGAAVRLDLSAIAKGFAVDKVAELIESEGLLNYLVEVGGETRAKGVNDRGVVWRLGVEKPGFSGRSALAVVKVQDMALATSGDYRNFFEVDGKKYSHTISPNTGWPVEHNLTSVSVLAESCMEADALATALLVMGEEKGYNFATEQNLKAYFIYRDGDEFKVRTTEGFNSYLL